MSSQVKSKERVADHGEVFTADREVQAMCDLVKQETERIDSRFLEPACGDGNFLAEILKRKLAIVKKKYRRSAYDWERYSLLALGSMYGVDIMQDNCVSCRERLFQIWEKEYKTVCKKESKECFPGVDVNGGICYFLMDANYQGDCEYVNISGGKESKALRDLSEYDIFIRRNEALSIVHKVVSKHEKTLSAPGGCSPQTPYGFLSTYVGSKERVAKNDCELLTSKGWSFVSRAEVNKSRDTIDLYKPMISKLSSEHAGNPDKMGMYRVLSRMELLRPGQICSQSYLTVCPCKTEQEATNIYNYLRTKFARFLILQTLAGMNLSISNFKFVPWLDFTEEWTDEKLFERYDITPEEIEFITSIIKDMDNQ